MRHHRMSDGPRLAKIFSIRTILPNVVTLAAFAAGLTAIRFAAQERWELAAASIVVAGVFDGLDGTVARLLKSTSRFGAELDSLSDVVAFGVAPAVVLYLWSLQALGRFGWAVGLVYAIAMALRLARFNARLDEAETPRRRAAYFTGVPAPVGAGLAMAPLMMEFSLVGGGLAAYPLFLALYLLAVAGLSVSTLPTLSLKAVRLRRQWFPSVMLFCGVMIAGLFTHIWTTLLVMLALYLLSLPVMVLHYRRRRHR